MADTVVLNQPEWTGLRPMEGIDKYQPELSNAMMFAYSYNGSRFSVLASPDDAPWGPGLGPESEAGKMLNEIDQLCYGDETKEKSMRIRALEKELGETFGGACAPLMRKLATVVAAVPEPTTLQEQLYPPTYTLRVLTKDGRICAEEAQGYELPAKYPPMDEGKLQEIGLDDALGVPTFHPSQIILGPRLQSLVWKATIDGEEVVCKVAVDVFGKSVIFELETYLKIQKAGTLESLRVPTLKGIIRSHTGVIGIVINYIPHKHHSLRTLLDLEQEGSVPEIGAALKLKWAQQIRQSVAQLHKLGILWRDVKTDNVLIDGNDDAVVLDFGGGNTMGWVDHDIYGTLEGDHQGVEKIMKALC